MPGLKGFAKQALLWSSFFIAVFALPVSAHADAALRVEINPDRSRNGESITFSIIIEAPRNVSVTQPQLPEMPDWELLNTYRSTNVSSQMTQGRIQTRFITQYNFLLRPLRVGRLNIPAVPVSIGGQVRRTTEVDVQVDALPSGAQSRQGIRPPVPQPRRQLSPFGDFEPPDLSDRREDLERFPIPERESFFVRAEPSKTEVFVGEQIMMSYVLYKRDVSLSSSELDKFPDFRGFLKEDLFIPRTWQTEAVNLHGVRYLRTELIRYALFPLSEGRTDIGQMVFRADARHSVGSLVDSFLRGQPPAGGGGPIPSKKSSPIVSIFAKALPEAPADLKNFTGAVGRFSLSVQPPVASGGGQLPTEQPLSLKIKIEGSGNFNMMQAPKLELPANIELVDNRTLYKFNEDGSGHREFEYILMGNKSGRYEIAPPTFSYFDPHTERYQSLEWQDPIVLDMAPGAAATLLADDSEASPLSEIEVLRKQWAPWRTGAQQFRAHDEADSRALMSWLVHPALIFFQVFMYFGAFFWLFVQRRHDKQQAFLQRLPWEKVRQRMLSKKDWPLFQLADMIEEWLALRLCGLCVQSSSALNAESSRTEFLSALGPLLKPTTRQKSLDTLKDFWTELDLLRFSGSQHQHKKSSHKALFKRVESLFATLEAEKINVPQGTQRGEGNIGNVA